MEKGLVTIVVPVYNTEKYLNRCISSLVNQSYQNIEILLVDDGSTDKSGEICDAWGAKDSRVYVIHKENEGAGIARNLGIEKAKGEYICFFDSDDYISKRTIEEAYERAYKNRAEIIILGRYLVKKGKRPVPVAIHTNKDTYSGKEVCQTFLPDLIGPDVEKGIFTGLAIGPWVIYSTELLARAGWRYESERRVLSEDTYSQVGLYQEVQTVSIVRTPVYYYCSRPESLSWSVNRYSMYALNSFYDQMDELVTKCGYQKEVRKRLAYPYFSMVIAYLKIIVKFNMGGKGKKEFQAVIRDRKLQDILSKTNFRREKPARKIMLQMMKKKWWKICGLLVWVNIKKESDEKVR